MGSVTQELSQAFLGFTSTLSHPRWTPNPTPNRPLPLHFQLPVSPPPPPRLLFTILSHFLSTPLFLFLSHTSFCPPLLPSQSPSFLSFPCGHRHSEKGGLWSLLSSEALVSYPASLALDLSPLMPFHFTLSPTCCVCACTVIFVRKSRSLVLICTLISWHNESFMFAKLFDTVRTFNRATWYSCYGINCYPGAQNQS